MAEKKTKAAETLFATLFGVSSLRDWLKTEDGKVAMAKISSKIFGIGPEDEGLFKKACTFLLDKIAKFDPDTQKQERKETLKRINDFLLELEANGYSRWWFRNVLAAMRKGDVVGENQAARTLHEIIQGNSFQEMIDLAGPDLIQKTYKKKISESWEIVIDKADNLKLLVDVKKFPKIFSEEIKIVREDFSDGMKSTFWWSWGIGIVVIIVAWVIICL